MSAGEIQRFNEEAKANPKILEELKAIGDDLEKVVAYANKRGYQFSMDDANASGSAELDEEDLDKVAGGGGAVGIALLMVVEVIGVVAVGSV